MMVHPSIERVLYGERGIIAGIASCVEAKCVMSALILLYSAIDAMAALTRGLADAESDGRDFQQWVRSYFLPQLAVPLSVEDLWGARCGVVHTYSPHSRLSHAHRARLLVYCWREGHRPDDAILANFAAQKHTIVLEIEAMVEAFHVAVERFSERIAQDPDLRRRVEHHVKGLLCYEPWNPVPILVSA